jgi:hypothetical protein
VGGWSLRGATSSTLKATNGCIVAVCARTLTSVLPLRNGSFNVRSKPATMVTPATMISGHVASLMI